MPDWLKARLPEGVAEIAQRWLTPGVLGGLTVFSVVMFVASLLGLPWFLNRIPEDYFTRRDTVHLGDGLIESGPLRVGLRVLRNVAGAILLVLGILMLILPGQGMIAIFVALSLLDFPGKRRVQARIIASRPVFKAINALRHRFGHPPLERPHS